MNLSKYVDILTNPEKVIEAEVKNSTVKAGTYPYIVIGLVLGLLFGLIILGVGSVIPGLGGFGVTGLVLSVILFPLGFLAISLINSAFILIGAKIFKGTGTFAQQYYLTSLTIPIVILLLIGAIIAAIIPFIGLIFYTLLYIVMLYWAIYVMLHIMKTIHGLTTFNAIMAIATGTTLMIIVLFIVVIIIVVAILGAALASLGVSPDVATGFLGLVE